MKMVFSGGEECYFAQSPRNCLKTHENAIVACGKTSTLCYIPSEDKWYKLSRILSTRYYFSQSIRGNPKTLTPGPRTPTTDQVRGLPLRTPPRTTPQTKFKRKTQK